MNPANVLLEMKVAHHVSCKDTDKTRVGSNR